VGGSDWLDRAEHATRGLRSKTTDETRLTLSEFLSMAKWHDDEKRDKAKGLPELPESSDVAEA
jgi:hypothetical protein